MLFRLQSLSSSVHIWHKQPKASQYTQPDYTMANRLGEPGAKVEAQPRTVYSSYSDCDMTGVAPTGSHFDEFNNKGGSNPPLQNDTWPIQAATGPSISLAGAISSPTVPTQQFYIPFPFGGAVPIESSGWPAEGIPWWSQTGPKGDHNTTITTDAGSWDASTSELQGYNTRETSLASPTTDPGYRKYGPDLLPDNLAWTTRNPSTSEQSQKGFNSAIDLTEGHTPTNSDVTFDPTRTAACTSPRLPQSSTRASSSRDARSQQPPPHTQPPSSPRGPGRSARSRTAASKSRAKNKAATAELVATEQAESQRHQELSAAFTTLQEEVFTLKSELLKHGNCDDHVIQEYLQNTARLLAIDSRATADSESGNATSSANSRPVHLPR